MAHYIDKDALVAWAKETYLCENASMIRKVCYKQLVEHLDTLEVKEVDLEKKSFVKIDRKLLFEICDAILNHYGYSDVNDCPENDSECFWYKWDEGFRKKVENVRKNS